MVPKLIPEDESGALTPKGRNGRPSQAQNYQEFNLRPDRVNSMSHSVPRAAPVDKAASGAIEQDQELDFDQNIGSPGMNTQHQRLDSGGSFLRSGLDLRKVQSNEQ
jgi:hypothetical protein